MVVLDAFVNVGCRRYLHKETFFLSEEISQNIKEGENASIRDVRPAEWPFLGYRDRDLEDEYLDDHVLGHKSRILVGYTTSLLIFFFGPFMEDLVLHGLLNYMGDGITDQEIALTGIPPDQWDYQGFNTVRSFTVDGIILATFILGLVTCALIYRLDRFKTKLCWVLYVTGAVYLVYIIVSGYNFYWTSDIWTALYGAPASWSIKLIFYEMSPLIPLLFMSLPFLLTLELVFAAVLTYLVIVPLYNDNENVWLNFKNEDLTGPESQLAWVFQLSYCKDNMHNCIVPVRWALVFPFIIACVLMVSLLLVNYFVNRAIRHAFIDRKILHCQKEKLVLTARLRDAFMKSESEKKEDLILDLFEHF